MVFFRHSMLCFGLICLLVGCGNPADDWSDQMGSDFRPVSGDASVPADWPNLYGPRYSSVSPEHGLRLDFSMDGPAEIWRYPVGKGYSAPVVKEGLLVTISRRDDEEVVECLDAETGKQRWEFRYPSQYDCSYEYSNGPYSTPIIGTDFVVSVSAEGWFHCLALETGEVRWKRNLLKDYNVAHKEWPVTTSPLWVDGKIVFNLGAVEQGAGMVALDPDRGDVLWKSTSHDYSHATPIQASMHGRTLIFAMTDPGLVCMDPSDGSLLWEVPHRIRQLDRYNAVSPVVWQDQVCIVTGPSVKPGFRCLKIGPDGSYTEPWKNIRLLNSQYTNLVTTRDLLLGFTPVKQGGPELVCIDLKKGKLAWKAKPGLGRGNLLVVQGQLLILGEDGHLAVYRFDGKGAAEVCRSEKPILNRPCYTSMALSNGLLFARNEQEIVCINLRVLGS